MCQNVTQGESDYLKSKGLNGLTYPLLTNGAILLPLVDNTGAVTAAQTITSSGEKRLVVDSAKRGAFHAINARATAGGDPCRRTGNGLIR
jgi:putative DNA primase/helicase